jgi:hypothetical protein
VTVLSFPVDDALPAGLAGKRCVLAEAALVQ